MQVDYRFPGFVSGLPPRCRKSERSVLCLMRNTSEIAVVQELDTETMPDVVDSLGNLSVMGYGNKVYRKIGTVSQTSDIDGILTDYLTNRMMVSVCLAYPSATAKSAPFPRWLEDEDRGIRSFGMQVGYGKMSLSRFGGITGLMGLVDIDDVREARFVDVERHTEAAGKLVSRLVLVGETVWAEMNNPLLVEHRGSVTLHDASYFGLCRGNHAFMPPPFDIENNPVEGSYFDLEVRVAPLVGRRAGDLLDLPSDMKPLRVYLERTEAEGPSDFEAAELERVAKAAVVAFFARGQRWRKGLVDKMWELRHGSAIFADVEIVADVVEGRACQAVAVAEELGYGDLPEFGALRDVLEGYRARPIMI